MIGLMWETKKENSRMTHNFLDMVSLINFWRQGIRTKGEDGSLTLGYVESRMYLHGNDPWAIGCGSVSHLC